MTTLLNLPYGSSPSETLLPSIYVDYSFPISFSPWAFFPLSARSPEWMTTIRGRKNAMRKRRHNFPFPFSFVPRGRWSWCSIIIFVSQKKHSKPALKDVCGLSKCLALASTVLGSFFHMIYNLCISSPKKFDFLDE